MDPPVPLSYHFCSSSSSHKNYIHSPSLTHSLTHWPLMSDPLAISHPHFGRELWRFYERAMRANWVFYYYYARILFSSLLVSRLCSLLNLHWLAIMQPTNSSQSLDNKNNNNEDNDNWTDSLNGDTKLGLGHSSLSLLSLPLPFSVPDIRDGPIEMIDRAREKREVRSCTCSLSPFPHFSLSLSSPNLKQCLLS